VPEERKGYFLSNAVAFTDSERLIGKSSLISDLVDDVESDRLSIFKKGVRLYV
jgi:hypothetical protein